MRSAGKQQAFSVVKGEIAPCTGQDRCDFCSVDSKISFASSSTVVGGTTKTVLKSTRVFIPVSGKEHLYYQSDNNHNDLVECMARPLLYVFVLFS